MLSYLLHPAKIHKQPVRDLSLEQVIKYKVKKPGIKPYPFAYTCYARCEPQFLPTMRFQQPGMTSRISHIQIWPAVTIDTAIIKVIFCQWFVSDSQSHLNYQNMHLT